MASLLISMPMKAKGAHELMAHGMPQMATRAVAKARERAKGAKIMVAANTKCDIHQVVCRFGRMAVIFLRMAAMPGGGRGVNRERW